MKVYVGYSVPSKNTFTIFEVDAIYNEECGWYELCKPIFGRIGTSISYVENRMLDQVEQYEWEHLNTEDKFLISLDKEKVEQFVKKGFDAKIQEYKELEANGIQTFVYEGE